jgi:nucleoside-diphosphate-sugar epimerase
MKNKKIIITGANGFIGSYLVDYFLKKGCNVIAFVHHLPTIEKAGIVYSEYNLAKPVDETQLIGCDYIIHCAYMKNDSGNNSDEININGTKNLYNLSQKNKVKRFIYLSSLSAHESALSHYGQTKLKIESVFEPQKDLILKPGLIIGNGGLFHNIVEIIKKSRVIPLINGGKNKIQILDVGDLAKCIDVATEKDITGKHVLASNDIISLYDLYKTISEKMKKKTFPIYVPFWAANMIFIFLSMLHIKLPITKESLLGLKQNIIWDVSDFKVFGFKPKSYQQIIHLLF